MYFKAIPISERLPESGKWVMTIDSDGEPSVYRLTKFGWNSWEPHVDHVSNNNLKITHWLEKVEDDKVIKKAEKWDNLHSAIDKYYEVGSIGDLIEIGETAAHAFGYL